MRANEFITENPIGELSTWLQQQSIGRKMKDRANAQKAKLPLIAKQVQKLLASRVAQIATSNVEDKKQELAKQVMSVMSRSTKVDIEGNPELFKDSMDALLSAITADANGVASNSQVRTLITDIVDKSFSVKMSGTNRMDKFKQELAAGLKAGKDPEDALNDAAESSGLDPDDFDTSTMPDVGTGPATPVPSGPIDPNAGEGSVYYEDLITKVKEHLAANPAKFSNRDTAAEFVDAQLEDNGVEDPEVRDAIVDAIMHDKDMPFNLGFEEEFRALVYSPNGTRFKQGDDVDNTAYVKHKGMWTRWEIGARSNWRFMEKITSKRDLAGLIDLAKKATSDMTPLTFRQDDVEGSQNLYRVSAR